MESRVKEVLNKKVSGKYNCAQAVACTYADIAHLDEETVYNAAAAFGAGIGALMQEWAFVAEYDRFMNGQNMRTYLIQGAVKDGPYEYPNREWGYGKINIYNTLLGQRF